MAGEELRALLGGKGWPVPEAGGCGPGAPEPARLRGNVCYVVLAVLLNEKVRGGRPPPSPPRGARGPPIDDPFSLPLPPAQNEVLVMQEAKRECYGSWYLPAGRMEPRETVVEAVRREVQEETGLQCRPLTLLAVEERGPAWIRFVFLARPTGGGARPGDARGGGLAGSAAGRSPGGDGVGGGDPPAGANARAAPPGLAGWEVCSPWVLF